MIELDKSLCVVLVIIAVFILFLVTICMSLKNIRISYYTKNGYIQQPVVEGSSIFTWTKVCDCNNGNGDDL